ncbi:MAG: fatty acid CoA ligase family protein [Opitutae bacterium]|nr:fatty acid CoA ligase family protein [Opitutae bacterium]
MHFNVSSFLSTQANEKPDAKALIYSYKPNFWSLPTYVDVSFKELDAMVDAVVHRFVSLGIARGTRVLLMVKPGLELIQIVFALLKIGAVPVVIDPGMGIGRFFECAKQSKVDAIIGGTLAINLAKWFLRAHGSIEKAITIDTQFKRSLKKHLGVNRYDAVEVSKDELAAVLFTSGSTGKAKGVCYTHSMFYAQIQLIKEEYGIESGEVDLPMLAVFALFNPALGMCTVVPEMNPSQPAKIKPKKIVNSILRNHITNSFGSPIIWSIVLNYCKAKQITLPSLKRVIMAGAPAPQALLEELKKYIPNGEIFTPYGATEALPVSSLSATEICEKQVGEFANSRRGNCVGRALPNLKIQIIEPEEGPIASIADVRKCAFGRIGEIIVAGPTVTQRYDQLESATELSKIKDNGFFWHRMGDVGWMDEAGYLWFCGRKAERVMTKEDILETVCCEAIFNQLDCVSRSALIDLGEGRAGIVIEPEAEYFPKTNRALQSFRKILIECALSDPLTVSIKDFFFKKQFPVDVRHNAKIHRLSLAKEFRKDLKPFGP